MEDVPDSEDADPQTGNLTPFTKNNLYSVHLLLITIPSSVASMGLVLALLVFALLSSSLRASLSASAALATPWDKKKHLPTPDRQSRFTLLVLQYVCMISGWFILATELHQETLAPDVALYSFVAVVSIWLIADAVLRWYAGKYAALITDRLLPVIRPVLDLLRPVGSFFHQAATALGVTKNETENQASPIPDKEDTDAMEEKEILLGVAAMGKTTAREAMVSKSNIKAFSVELDFHELMDLVNKYGYSRIPVYRHNLDNIEGILYIKDLLPHIQEKEDFAWQKLMRKPYLIPETKRLDNLLEEFQERRVHMAIVIGEYGSTRGLITLEDIIEEIFGDINDEHDDVNETKFVRLDSRNFLFEGQALLNDVIRTLDLDYDYFTEQRVESETLGGLILELFTRVPRQGEEISFRDLTFKIQSATKKQVKKVKVTLPD